MRLVKTRRDEERSVQYYNIENISHIELRGIYKVLLAEEARSKIVKGWNRGSKAVRELLGSDKLIAETY